MELTFAIIKPDAVRARVAGKIIQRIEDEGFQIRAMRLVNLSKREAEGFYAVHRERPFFPSLTAFMSSGPAIVLALEAADAIKKWRTLMGATDPAKDGGIRADVLLPGNRVGAVNRGKTAPAGRPCDRRDRPAHDGRHPVRAAAG